MEQRIPQSVANGDAGTATRWIDGVWYLCLENCDIGKDDECNKQEGVCGLNSLNE